MALCIMKIIPERDTFISLGISKYAWEHLISEILLALFILAVSLVGNLSDPGIISYRHSVNLPFDLLVPGQGSLQAFLGVQLRVSTLVDVSTNTRHNISRGNGHEAFVCSIISASLHLNTVHYEEWQQSEPIL